MSKRKVASTVPMSKKAMKTSKKKEKARAAVIKKLPKRAPHKEPHKEVPINKRLPSLGVVKIKRGVSK